MGIARLFFKKLYFFRYNSFLLFCTGSPLYFCKFLLIYNIAQYNIAQYFLWQMKTFPLGCSQLPSGLFWQNLFLRPAGLISPGLILAKSLSTPRWFGFDGAYFDKISFCAPLVQKPAGIIGLVLSTIPSPTQIHKNTDRQISSLSISIFVCQYLFHQRSVTAGSPSRPRTLAAFLRKEPW